MKTVVLLFARLAVGAPVSVQDNVDRLLDVMDGVVSGTSSPFARLTLAGR